LLGYGVRFLIPQRKNRNDDAMADIFVVIRGASPTEVEIARDKAIRAI